MDAFKLDFHFQPVPVDVCMFIPTVYPYSSCLSLLFRRSIWPTHQDAQKVVADKTTVNGVTIMAKKAGKYVIDGTAIDYMRCALLGIMRLLLTLWISSDHNEEYYIGRQVKIIDSRLEAINPSSYIHY